MFQSENKYTWSNTLGVRIVLLVRFGSCGRDLENFYDTWRHNRCKVWGVAMRYEFHYANLIRNPCHSSYLVTPVKRPLINLGFWSGAMSLLLPTVCHFPLPPLECSNLELQEKHYGRVMCSKSPRTSVEKATVFSNG